MAATSLSEAIRLHRPSTSRTVRTRLFIDAREQPRSRRATDVLLVVATSVGLLFLAATANPPSGFANDVTGFVDALPDLLDGLWRVMIEFPLLLAIGLLLASLLARRWAVARDMVLAAALGALGWVLLWRYTSGEWPSWSDAIADAAVFPAFPAARLSIPSAAIITISPHVVRPMRRVGRWVLSLGTLSAVVLTNTTGAGAIAGLLVGAAAAGCVHLLVGSSAGRPNLGDVAAAADELGVPVVRLGAAARQQAGNFAVFADGDDGRRFLIKLYGRDAHDAALVSTVWRTLWYRSSGSPVGLARRRQVEHEAFLTLLAERAGVLTDHVVTAGSTESDDAVLVLERVADELPLVDPTDDDRPDDPLCDTTADPDEIPADADAQLWSVLATLHGNGIAHGLVDDRHLLVADGQLGIENFRSATVNATDDRHLTDVAQAFVTIALRADVDRAVASLRAARGDDALTEMLPYLQQSSLTPWQRRQVRHADLDLDEVRKQAAEAVGVEPPELVPLRRFTVGSIVKIALPLIALAALVSAASGFDFEEFTDALSETIWWLVIVGFFIAQLPRVCQAVGTMGASPVQLPLGPVYALQLAVSYINLAIPSSAARMAVNIRFFQRHGVPPGGAVAAGAIDGFAGFIVQATLLTAILLLTPASLDLQVTGGDESSGGLSLLGIFVIAGLIGLIVVFALPRTRRFIVEWVRKALVDGKDVLVGLRSPRRLTMVFGGNLGAELLFALSLTTFVRALNGDVSYTDVLFTNMTVALLAGLLPIPGGIGVTEGGLILGLTSAGMPHEAAFAAVILYRLASFYLPPVWGFFAFRWLERNRHL